MEVASAGYAHLVCLASRALLMPFYPSASHDDNGADRLGEVSLKENANKDCADDSDTALQALVRRVVDALSAFIMYIGPYHDERGAASISHLTDETKKELLSRVSSEFLRFVLHPLIASQ